MIKLISNKQEFVLPRTSLLQHLCMSSLSLAEEIQVTEKVKGQTAQDSVAQIEMKEATNEGKGETSHKIEIYAHLSPQSCCLIHHGCVDLVRSLTLKEPKYQMTGIYISDNMFMFIRKYMGRTGT